MKALVCEMCGGQDLIKKDDMYVCQHCGTKYTVEEARKLMVEGTVKIDNSDFVQRYLQNARRAKEKEDWEETEKYYNLVEQNDPTNIEAIFYSSYGKAKASLVDSDIYKRQAAFKVLQNCVSIIDDNFDIEKESDQKEIVKQICNDIVKMYESDFVYTQRKNGYGIVVSDNKQETYALFNNLASEFCTTLEEIIKKYPSDRAKDTIFYYDLAVKCCDAMLSRGHFALISLRKPTEDRLQRYHDAWHEIDSTHVNSLPPLPQQTSSGGCYIATAVYGSYDCPQVWTLRRYRDYSLARTWYGRAFIRTYYAISPTLVKWFGETKWFKRLWQGKLDRMVSRLNHQGVEDTPYIDREWE